MVTDEPLKEKWIDGVLHFWDEDTQRWLPYLGG